MSLTEPESSCINLNKNSFKKKKPADAEVVNPEKAIVGFCGEA